jgi:glycyl-tRNA synthetase
MELYQKIINIALQRGFIAPSFEIYGPIGGFYDYGPVGFKIIQKMKELWREKFIYNNGFFEISSSCMLPKKVLQASGHLDNFTDPVIFCKKEKKAFRADQLILDINKEEGPAHFSNIGKLKEYIKKNKIVCPDCGSELTEPTNFNLMFSTFVGAIEPLEVFLRPETAQGIFLNFKRIYLQNGSKLPIGIGQIGKSFRNEISPRKGLIRLREFEQMELEYFFNPKKPYFEGFNNLKNKKIIFNINGERKEIQALKALKDGFVANEILAAFLVLEQELFFEWGIDKNKFHFKILDKSELPHYSLANIDAEVQTSYGVVELSGTAYRTDFDLSSHQKFSSENLEVLDPQTNTTFIPHVIEPSIGVDRSFYCVLEHCFVPASSERDWDWFKFPVSIAPYLVGVFPLFKKDGLDDLAKEVFSLLKKNKIDCYYSETGSIGKRYARADEIGVPYCLTIDYTSKEQKDLTIRFRDDTKQIRVKIDQLVEKILELKQKNATTVNLL